MKKMRFLVLVLLFVNFHVSAQSSFVQPVILGLKVGVNASLFNEDVDAFNPSSSLYLSSFKRFIRASGFGGVTVDYMITERFSAGAEILYNARGMAYREENNNVIMIGKDGAEQAYNYFKYNIDYIELPLTANYNVLDVTSDNWLTGYVGLAPAVAVSKTVRFDFPQGGVGPSDDPADQSTELTNVRAFNTSALAGIQFGGVPSFLGAYGDLRASYTLLPVFNKEPNGADVNLNTRMLSFSLGLGIKF